MRQESHRVQWQQWGQPQQQQQQQQQQNAQQQPQHHNDDDGVVGGKMDVTRMSKRDLITRSASIRLSDAARAKDVTRLLRQNMQLSSSLSGAKEPQDHLVLVGTLYHDPPPITFRIHQQHYYDSSHKQQQQRSADSKQQQSQSSSLNEIVTQQPLQQPFHLVRSLLPDENPLAIRDQMEEKLRKLQQQQRTPPSQAEPLGGKGGNKISNRSKTSIAPKLQWFFVPSDPTSPILGSVDLDGYSTTMEEEEEGDDDDDDDDVEVKDDNVLSRGWYPWIKPKFREEPDGKQEDGVADDDDDDEEEEETKRQERKRRRRRQRNQRLYRQLAQTSKPTVEQQHHHHAGYLWKQSLRDPHVWRKVYCVLTEEHLWYIRRVPDQPSTADDDHDDDHDDEAAPPPHGRIGVTRGAAVEGSTPSNPELGRLPPFAFQVTSCDTSTSKDTHLFRAKSRPDQLRWMRCIADRIRHCQECTTLLEHAELMLIDETVARRHRLNNSVVPPRRLHSSVTTDSVTRWGMEVVEYRELCRHVTHRLPSKTPVVATSPKTPTLEEAATTAAAATTNAATATPATPITLPDLETQVMIRSAWENASVLLAKASSLVDFSSSSPEQQHNSRRGIDTHCQHIEYVLTGRRRRPLMSRTPSSATDTDGNNNNSKVVAPTDPPPREIPPPTDLFDSLLSELQILAG